MHFSTWNIDASQILSRQELAAVLKDLKRRAARLPNVQMNLAILRLACCCGLPAKYSDVVLERIYRIAGIAVAAWDDDDIYLPLSAVTIAGSTLSSFLDNVPPRS